MSVPEGTRIDDLPPIVEIDRSFFVVAMINGVTVRITVGQMLDLVIGAAPGQLDTLQELADAINDDANFAATVTAALAEKANAADTTIHSLTAKTVPVDADEFRLADSAASFGSKRLSWLSIKTAIKAFLEGAGLLLSQPVSIGYQAGAGGAVTQTTSKSTSVTLNKPTGRITTHNASLASAATAVFSVVNSLCSDTDTVILNLVGGASGYDNYIYWPRPQNGGFNVVIFNRTGGALAESLAFNFTIVKGAIS